ncbi:hypothetical protein [Anaerobaca lacustris]|uniref:Restriction endonuclease n=1 Tax=Anaerobaca lacustris TaxID=3044600 RepID=A0AAW6U2M5_9BACT|nr:hypothetical protein [Sedimentisphaerales bacterium M17dextr]
MFFAMNLFPNELPHLTQREMAAHVLSWLQAHPQLRVSDQNRLSRQCQLIAKTQQVIYSDHADWRHFVQSLKDIQEYSFMIHVLGERLMGPPFADRFVDSLRDSMHPADSGTHTPGRNAQFELFLAALADRGGLEVGGLPGAGPDWIVTAPAGRWALEAKRTKNLKMVRKHIRKAAKQILDAQIGGVIVIDVSLAYNAACSPLSEHVPDRSLMQAHAARTKAFGEQLLPFIVQWIGRANVGFVVVYESVICPASTVEGGEKSWALIGLWSKLDTVSADSPSRAHFDNLWQLLEAALPNW